MGIFASTEEVPVELESCHCDGTPHDHDTVWLRSDLSPDGGIAAMHVLSRGAPDTATIIGALGRAYLIGGIVRWTFVDEKGDPIEVTPYNVAQLKEEIVLPVADKADDLYSERLMRPLVARASKSSRNGHTARSTSARRTTSGTRRKP